MKTQRLYHLVCPLLILASACLLQSCVTSAGLITGAVIDSKRPDHISVPLERADSLKRGMNTMVLLRDGRTVTGKFLEISKKTPPEYAAQYENFRKTPEASGKLPGLGDTIVLISRFDDWKNGVSYTGEFSGTFIGFDFGQILIREATLQRDLRLSVYGISRLTGNRSETFYPDELEILIMTGSIPFQSTIDLEQDKRVESIALEQVVMIEYKNKSAMRKGALAGLTIDAAILGIATVASIIYFVKAGEAAAEWWYGDP